MLRTVRRWFTEAEVKKLGEEVDSLIERHQDYGHKIEGLSMRLERFLNRTSMRALRSERATEDRDREILDEIRARSGNGGQEPNPEEWR